MIEPRVVYACNHYVVESFDESIELFMRVDRDENNLLHEDVLFSSSDLSKKDGVITVTSSECLSVKEYYEDNTPLLAADCTVYSQGEDFDIIHHNKMTDVEFAQTISIRWHIDNPPSMYLITLGYTRVVNKLYDENECPRCGGEGWYVGIFENGNINPSSVSGGNKLVQSFLKYIYTKKLASGYGSRITGIPGKYSMNDVEMINAEVQSELMSFKDYYTDKISAAVLNGKKVEDSEKLVSQTVSNIEIDEENKAIKVTVTFSTKDGSLGSVNLTVANL